MRFLMALPVIVTLSAAAASAQAPSDIGARAAGAETQMQARGYTNTGAQTGDDRVWTYWWNPATRTCVTVATVEGRYDSITISPAPDCQQQAAQLAPLPAAAPPPQQGEHWFDLGLICFGEGKRPTAATTYGYTWDYDKGRYVYGDRTELTTQDFDASVTIQLWDGGGRIRLPGKLIPPIHSRGDHGWWELDDVVTGRDTITAGYRLNGLNRPTIAIDRRTRRISIHGAADYAFSGSCDTADNTERRF